MTETGSVRVSMRALCITLGLAIFAIAGGRDAVAAANVVPEARAALPDEVQKAGVLRLATSLQWPPFGFADDKSQPTGIDGDVPIDVEIGGQALPALSR